jgi:AbrB family looped-hinge helix DNA binding protein
MVVAPKRITSYHPGKMKNHTRLTSKGQVVIPKAVRDHLKWKPGTRLGVEPADDGSVVLRPASSVSSINALIEELSGCLRELGGDPIADLEADHRAELEADER